GRLGVEDVHVEDGSGLSVNNRISPRALAAMLRMAADPEHPDRAFTISGLPTAHFTGTLADRYGPDAESARCAAPVRGNPGTVNGASTPAGTGRDADGRLLVFVFMANDEAPAGTLLDTLAAEVADCGCS